MGRIIRSPSTVLYAEIDRLLKHFTEMGRLECPYCRTLYASVTTECPNCGAESKRARIDHRNKIVRFGMNDFKISKDS